MNNKEVLINKKRLQNIDLLKMICCIAVIIIHISAQYIYKFTNKSFIISVFFCITRFAVPCFIMISGYFAISNKRKNTCTVFYKNKIKTILVPTIIFSLGYFILYFCKRLMEYFLFSSPIKLLELITSLLTGNLVYHMWYLYMFIFIYAITPVLWKIKEKIGERRFSKLGIILFIISIPFALTSTHKFTYDIGNSIYFVGYYILGYTLAKGTVNKSNKKFTIYLLIGGLILLVNSFLTLYGTDYNLAIPFIGNVSIINNHWILIAIGSIFIYKAFLYLEFKIDLSKIAKYSLYIYLFHMFFVEIFTDIIVKIDTIVKPYLFVPLVTSIIFLCSLILSKIYVSLYKKIDKNEFIENKLYLILEKIFN